MPRKPLDRISRKIGEISRRLPTKRYRRCLQTRRRLSSALGARCAHGARRFGFADSLLGLGMPSEALAGRAELAPRGRTEFASRGIVTRRVKTRGYVAWFQRNRARTSHWLGAQTMLIKEGFYLLKKRVVLSHLPSFADP